MDAARATTIKPASRRSPESILPQTSPEFQDAPTTSPHWVCSQTCQVGDGLGGDGAARGGCRLPAEDGWSAGGDLGRPSRYGHRGEARDGEKYGDPASDIAAEKARQGLVTDWEAYDVEVRFEFLDNRRLKMSLADGAEPLEATWRVAETSPTGCTIEVVTTPPTDDGPSELRTFELEVDERNGEIVGFLLTETGADRQLGALYFARGN